ncbi:MAG: DedA family protein [Rhodospirillales bacterium]|nr:DedA family protein [Rhodospirillales bacterium]
MLAAVDAIDEHPDILLLLVATGGNTLGSLTNWFAGRFCLKWQDRRWFPIGKQRLEQASSWFSRYGVWTLLLAWLPFIGDPLTLAAGVFRVRLLPFILLVGAGKAGRYGAVLLAV